MVAVCTTLCAMRWFVTGASGCVGTALGHRLKAQGEGLSLQVRVAKRLPPSLQGDACEALLGDPNALRDAMVGADVVVHCAGVQHPDSSERAMRWVNVAGTENALKAARAAGVPCFLHLSCADVTLHPGDRVHWDEKRLVHQPAGALARSKKWAEDVVLTHNHAGFSTVALRPGRIWGPGDRTWLPRWVAEAQGQGGIQLVGNGDNLLALAHVSHVVDAILSAGTRPALGGKAFYVGDDEFVTAREFFEALSVAFSLPAPRVGPRWAWAYAGVRLREGLGAHGRLSAELIHRGRSAHFNLLEAIEGLEFRPTLTLEGGMASWARDVANTGGLDAWLAQAREGEPSDAVDEMVLAAGGD